MGYEVPVVSADLVNGAFLDKIFTAGQVKQAEEVASMYIRQRLYEDGIQPQRQHLFPSRAQANAGTTLVSASVCLSARLRQSESPSQNLN